MLNLWDSATVESIFYSIIILSTRHIQVNHIQIVVVETVSHMIHRHHLSDNFLADKVAVSFQIPVAIFHEMSNMSSNC